ncbi:MAG TPA: ABC transporter substrate-binding protein [Chloroflexota bacterium]|nr:ABC transporter substrate-binding protein [Chloroflexota bacterium]
MHRWTARPTPRQLVRGALLGVLLVLGCGPAPAAREEGAAPAPGATAAPTVAPDHFRYAYPATSLSYAYALLGEAQGFYLQQGLAPELVQIPASPLLAALLAGEVDYSAGAAGGIRLAVRGQPVRLVSTVSLQNFSLVARPEIEDGAALRGKLVGVASRGASADRALQRAVRSLGLDPQTDVTVTALGDQQLLWEALRVGRVAAIMASPPVNVQARHEGYRVLTNTAELEPAVIGGVAATLAVLERAHERTKRLIQAEWEIVRYMKAHPAETAAFFAARFGISPEEAAAAYAEVVPHYWDRLELHLAAVDATIAAEREAAEITAEVPREQVVDPSLVAEVRAALAPAP